MSYWVLTVSGMVISCTTVQRLTDMEKSEAHWKQQTSEYDELIEERLQVQGQDISHKIVDVDEWNKLSVDSIDQEFIDDFNKVINDNRLPEIDDDKVKNKDKKMMNLT